MEIRIEAPDASSASGLARRLAAGFRSDAISLDAARREVRFETERDSSLLYVRVFDAVEAWIADCGVLAAAVWIGGRRYSLASPDPASRTEQV